MRWNLKLVILDIKIINDDLFEMSLDEIEDEFEFDLILFMRLRVNMCFNDLF